MAHRRTRLFGPADRRTRMNIGTSCSARQRALARRKTRPDRARTTRTSVAWNTFGYRGGLMVRSWVCRDRFEDRIGLNSGRATGRQRGG
jgi:hypothetical protein